jgi:hypothetical protein
MHKRASERIDTKIEVRFFFGRTFFSGTATNLSENGIFISTNTCFPTKTMLNLFIPLEKNILKVLVEVRRVVKTYDDYDGMGVKILNSPEQYLEFIKGLEFFSS